MTQMGTTIHSPARRVSAAMAEAIATRDLAAMERLLHPEATVWHNTDGVTLARAAALEGIGQFFAAARQCGYADVRLAETGDGFVEQHIAEMAFGQDGPLLRVPCCLVVTLRDGLILSIEEYLDSGAFAATAG